MRLRNVAGLALALALFAGILGWLHERQQPPAQPPASRAWLPGLKPHQVTALCIATPGQPTIRARRDGKDWTLASKDGYPASGETIRQLLRSLADARLLEEKSASPENRERMGLSDQGKGQASRITLERGDAPPLVLLLGKRTSQGGQLVRQADDEGAWLIDRTVGLPVNDLALLDPRLTGGGDAQRGHLVRFQPWQPGAARRRLRGRLLPFVEPAQDSGEQRQGESESRYVTQAHVSPSSGACCASSNAAGGTG